MTTSDQVADAATGEVYYHNVETGEVSWEFPGGMAKCRSHQVLCAGLREQTKNANSTSALTKISAFTFSHLFRV